MWYAESEVNLFVLLSEQCFIPQRDLEWQVKQFAETSKWQSWDFKTCFMTPVHGMMLTKYVEVFIWIMHCFQITNDDSW